MIRGRLLQVSGFKVQGVGLRSSSYFDDGVQGLGFMVQSVVLRVGHLVGFERQRRRSFPVGVPPMPRMRAPP